MIEGWIGGIAIEPGKARCAITYAREGERIEGQDIASSQTIYDNDLQRIAAEAARFFEGRQLGGLGVSMYGLVDPNDGRFLGSKETPGREFLLGQTLAEHVQAASREIKILNDAVIDAVAEYYHGFGLGLNYPEEFFYLKITSHGVGSALISGGLPRFTPTAELGHILARRFPGDPYSGRCGVHHDCFQGLADGQAMLERWKLMNGNSKDFSLDHIDPNHEIWLLETYYLAQLCMIATLSSTPRKIIVAGDVMRGRAFLYPQIRAWFKELVGAFPNYSDLDNLTDYIEPEKITTADFSDSLALSLRGALEVGRMTRLQLDRVQDFKSARKR